MSSDTVLQSVVAYYADKLSEHGPVPKGVDWKNAESQDLRFQQLIRLLNLAGDSTLLDFGCGYGALLSFLRNRDITCGYVGFDAGREMVVAAREIHSADEGSTFSDRLESLEPTDYVVASGLFNVRFTFDDAQFEEFILATINDFDRLSKRGFAFNMLTKYSDSDRMRSNLYYADPAFFFDYCKRKFSRHVALLHDYDLYEFTIVVSKTIS
jgi:SAM-dependent methyltransferase